MKQIILALMLAVAGIGAAVAANPIREGNMISGHVLVKGSEEPYYGYKKQHSRNSGPIAGDCLERGFPVYSW